MNTFNKFLLILLFSAILFGSYRLGTESKTVYKTIEKCKKSYQEKYLESASGVCNSGILRFKIDRVGNPEIECK